MNKEDELFIAKKTAERAGYKVTMPGAAPAGDGAPAPAPAPAAEPPKPAEPAPAPAPEATPAAPPAEDKPKTPAWLANASRFMGKDD